MPAGEGRGGEIGEKMGWGERRREREGISVGRKWGERTVGEDRREKGRYERRGVGVRRTRWGRAANQNTVYSAQHCAEQCDTLKYSAVQSSKERAVLYSTELHATEEHRAVSTVQ
jgi:hypothetical protein